MNTSHGLDTGVSSVPECEHVFVRRTNTRIVNLTDTSAVVAQCRADRTFERAAQIRRMYEPVLSAVVR